MVTLFEFIGNHTVLVAVFVTLIVLFIFNEIKRSGKSVSTAELVNLVNNEDALVVDLRDMAEFEAGHIADAQNIPFAALKERLAELEKFKEKPIVMACKMGQHSGAAGVILRRAGFDNVSRLKGGYAEWTGQNLPLVKS